MTEVPANLLVGLREKIGSDFCHPPLSVNSLLHLPVDAAGRVVTSAEVIQTSIDKSELYLSLISAHGPRVKIDVWS